MSSNQQIYIDSDEEQQYVNENGLIKFQFANVGNNQNRQVLRLGKYDPKFHYRTVYDGLNMQGTCRNQSCVAKNQNVWAFKGYGFFSIAEQIDEVQCPMCKQLVPYQTVKSLGYKNCTVKVVGKKIGDPKKFQWTDKQAEGKFVKFSGYDGKTVEWGYLNLTVSKN